MKAETVRVIRGTSSIDREMLNDLVTENKDAINRVQLALMKAKNALNNLEAEAEKMRRECDDLFTWANAYADADFDKKQAILQQFIKEVRVGRDYEVEIVLNVSLEEFEEFKAHSAAQGSSAAKKSRRMKPKPAPKSVSYSSNDHIVVLDETAGDSPKLLSIPPKKSAHAKVTYSVQETSA